MKVTKITIGRLFNLGSYEHIRYDVSVEVGEGESAKDAMIGLEKIINALAPESKCCVSTEGEIDREMYRITEMHKLLSDKGPDEFRQRHGHFVGTPEDYIQRCEDHHMAAMDKREKYKARAAKARELLDSMGGATVWKDSKLEWEDGDDGF